MSRTIVVIGATGAQGLPVVRHLLRSSTEPGDGRGSPSPSPWKVHALTRDVNHKRAKELVALGAELVQGKCRIGLLVSSGSRAFWVLRLSYMSPRVTFIILHDL